MLPRVEGGAAMIVTGKKSSHKTGVLLHKCFKAVFEKGAKVLYLAAEGAHGIRTARLPALCRRHGRTLEDLTGRWVTMDTAPGLMSEAQIAQAIAECKAKGFKPDIIVIDTLSRVVGTVDMNAPGTGANIIADAELFARAFNALAVLVSHPPQSGEGTIGSSQQDNLAYAIWRVKYDKDESISNVYVEKMKDGPADLTCRSVSTGQADHPSR
jgi:predicted ATP-dependent serine protease